MFLFSLFGDFIDSVELQVSMLSVRTPGSTQLTGNVRSRLTLLMTYEGLEGGISTTSPRHFDLRGSQTRSENCKCGWGPSTWQ